MARGEPATEHDQERSNALVAVLSRAEQAQLQRDPIWLGLLQIDKGLLGLAHTSSATSEHFFLSPRGRHDARAELVATITSFFDSNVSDEEAKNPQCAFVARRQWLTQRLSISDEELPQTICPDYQAWREGLAATGLTLIYPEGFMNNPASMFGHTLLRIDSGSGGRDDAMLGHAVDFTGKAGGDQGLLFILRGILGLYPGQFDAHPYYEQLRRYAEWENRDIWEYRLDVSDAELDFLLMHLWELRGVDHPYYFFTENCSYHLYRLLELMKPELRALDALRTFVAPVDTVRAATKAKGFIKEIRFRASPATQLSFMLERSSRSAAALARAMATGEVAPTSITVSSLETDEQVEALDMAYDLLRYSFVQGTRERGQSQILARRILVARSRLVPLNPTTIEVPQPLHRPDEGHGSAMARVGAGYRDGESYVDFNFRPAYHGLMDPEAGYPAHMQIRFMDTRLRYFPERGRIRLEEVTAVEALSLSPRGNLFRPLAWSLKLGLATRRVSRAGALRDKAVARADIGAGVALEPKPWLHFYGLATLNVDAGPGLRRDASFGPGASSGLYLTWPQDLVKTHLFANLRGFVAGEAALHLRTGGEQRLTLSRNIALRLGATYNRVSGVSYLQAEGSLQVHF